MDDDIKRLTQETCLALIPQFYDGVLEATRIQQVNDAIIEPFIAGIMRIHRNAYIQTMDADALSELESGLGIEPSGTIEQRRQVVIDALCDPNIINDAALHALIQSLDGGSTNDFEIDPVQLLLCIKKVENTESDDDYDDLVNARHVVQPVIPQNLNVELRTTAKLDKNLSAVYGSTSWLNSFLGVVERHAVITGPHGLMTDSGDEGVQSAVYGDEIGRPTALYTNTLEETEIGAYGEIETAVEALAYLRASAYQHLNKSVTANSTNFLYESGADTSLYVDGAKTYTLKGAYTNGDVSVDITGASLTLIESSGQYSLRLIWGSTAAQVCYIRYEIV